MKKFLIVKYAKIALDTNLNENWILIPRQNKTRRKCHRVKKTLFYKNQILY